MKLRKLSPKDRKLFDRYLNLERHELAVYSFENIYIWRELFDIRWQVIDACLCLFFIDKCAAFLYLPCLGKNKTPRVFSKAFGCLDTLSKNRDASRIENIEEKDLIFYQQAGYDCREKFGDYLYLRSDLTNLKGNEFKAKRADFNYFTKHNRYEYLDYTLRYRKECLDLYDRWQLERAERYQDKIYQGLLSDNRKVLESMLDSYADLEVTGRLVKIEGAVRAFTFGFKLNSGTFCVLFETVDLSIKGLAQFIFREFCRGLKDYKYINAMDDSGLDNLKKVKLSWRPVRLVPAYFARRPRPS